jgi:ABC-type multidrug transport system ATPase subunit
MLRLAGVRKTYGKTVAVEALDLEIRRGEVFGLLGPNGAGKATIVGRAVGLLKPDQGSVEIEGSWVRPPNGRARQDRHHAAAGAGAV